MSAQKPNASRLACSLLVALLALALPISELTRAQTSTALESAPINIRAAQIIDLSHYLESTQGDPDAYIRTLHAIFGEVQKDEIKVTAYEENESFVYAVASMRSQDSKAPISPAAGGSARHVRRFIALNPSTFLIEDEFANASSPANNLGGLRSAVAPKVSSRTVEIDDPSGKVSAELLYPSNASYRLKHGLNGGDHEGYIVGIVPLEKTGGTRFLQVFRVGKSDSANAGQRYDLTATTDNWKFTATIGSRVFTLTLPPPSEGAGTVSIANSDGKTLVATRPFPSGILPHGPEGNRLLNLWDSEYRRPEPALWDIGRPADELQRVIEGGKIARCRAVDMCCGSGTDAIYLASKGFDVTAIDVAPTALGLAMEKARKANVSVHWKVADILAPPELKPFDFIYDRGCYHVVRDQNLSAYIEAVRRFSHPGTQFLLLATRRGEQPGGEGSGVTEEELRVDFLSLFDVEWLRQIILESNLSSGGPPGWSALMKRNSAP